MSETGSETEAAVEELYGASPDDFIARRDALAKERKAAGDVAGAEELKKRRRPTQIAWVLNQFARRRPDDVAELADVGRELVREQRKALRGEGEGGASFRESIARQRDVVKRSLERLGAVMKELGVDPEAHRDELASVVRSAIVDPAIALALEEGRLEKAPEVASGFGGLASLGAGGPAAAPSKPPSKPAAPAKAATKADQKAAKKAEQEAARARKNEERERERERERARAEEARERERTRAEEARAKRAAQQKAIHAARAELHAAEAEAKKRQAAADEAERTARHLATEAAESARRVTEARRALARAEA